MATLLILKGANQGQRMVLEKDRISLGRNRDCDVVIDFPAVSREHAHILRIEGKYYIADGDARGNASRNGTFVNNQQIDKQTLLKDNDRIKICDFLCTFHEGTLARPLRPDLRAPEEAEEPAEEGMSTSTVEARVSRLSASQLLESQPTERMAALLEISANLGKTLELDALLPRIADNLFGLFKQADRCFLIQREPRDDLEGKLLPKLIKTRRAVNEAGARFSRTIAKQCLETSQALLSEDASSDSRFGLAQSIADFRIRSVMVAPLCTGEGKAFGVIQLDTQDRSKKFTTEDLKFLAGVGNVVAMALENAQLHRTLVAQEIVKRDLELGKQVQQGFLPQKLPNLPGYQFYSHYDPAREIGGDYYDFIPLGEGRLGILLGDVAGKGVPAALLMAKLSAEARFSMLTETDLAAAVSKLNNLLMQAELMDRFVTLAAVVLDPTKHTVTVVNAGHQTPLLFRPMADSLGEVVNGEIAGLPLGVMEGFPYVSAQADLRAGDSLLMFTDGITDAQNLKNERIELEGVQKVIKAMAGEPVTPPVLGDRLIKAVKQYAAGRAQYDDIALVCFGRMK